MRNFENVPKQIIDAIPGEEVRALIEHGITPLFLRGSGPTNDAEREHELMALAYGLRRIEGQGGMVIGDGLSHGSPIMLGEFARRALEQSRATLRSAANYRAAEGVKIETVLQCGALHTLDPLQGPEIPMPQPESPEPPQQPPALPQTEV